jgi:uncharacterized oligopeptide transporter (OPT) family protein
LFFLLFLPPQVINGQKVRTVSTLLSDRFPMPAALQWKGVSDLISGGLKHLPTSAILSMALAAAFAAAFEIARIKTKGKFPLSPVGIGLGVVLPVDASIAMFAGAFVFWWMGRKHSEPGTQGHRFWVGSMEPVCAGLISGAALVGVVDAIVNVLL